MNTFSMPETEACIKASWVNALEVAEENTTTTESQMQEWTRSILKNAQGGKHGILLSQFK